MKVSTRKVERGERPVDVGNLAETVIKQPECSLGIDSQDKSADPCIYTGPRRLCCNKGICRVWRLLRQGTWPVKQGLWPSQ